MKFNKGTILLSILILVFAIFYLMDYMNRDKVHKKSLNIMEKSQESTSPVINHQESEKILEQNSFQNETKEMADLESKAKSDLTEEIKKESEETLNGGQENSQEIINSENEIKENNQEILQNPQNELNQDSSKPEIKEEEKKLSFEELKNKILSVNPDDLVMGNQDSDIVIFEYTSITCPHCKKFHEQVFPKIKSDLIDQNKILYVARDFPTDTISFRSSLLFSELKDKFELSKRIKLREFLIKNQDQIAKVVFENRSNPKEAFNAAMNVLKDIFKVSIGLSEDEFERLTNLENPETKKIAENVISKIDELSKFLGEESGAPTFLIFNKTTGKFKKIEGVKQFDEWGKIIFEVSGKSE